MSSNWRLRRKRMMKRIMMLLTRVMMMSVTDLIPIGKTLGSNRVLSFKESHSLLVRWAISYLRPILCPWGKDQGWIIMLLLRLEAGLGWVIQSLLLELEIVILNLLLRIIMDQLVIKVLGILVKFTPVVASKTNYQLNDRELYQWTQCHEITFRVCKNN